MMQETVKAGANKIILTTREELEGCIYAAVRTIIPELANYKSPAEEAADALTLEAAINFLEGLGYPTTPSNLYNSGLFAAGLRRSMGNVRHRRAAEYPRSA